MMERVMVAASRNLSGTDTVICGTRYGNVMASRGSVIPLFLDQVRRNRPITVTDPEMTRFMMTLEDAIELVMFAFQRGGNGDIFVQKAPAGTVRTLATAILELMGRPHHEIREIGTRHGEKLYETLLSREERAAAEDLVDYFRVPPDDRDLNYGKFYELGEKRIALCEDYNSHNAEQLDVEGMKRLLMKLELVELAPILDPLLVPRTIAAAIGLRDEPQRSVVDMLCDYLRDKSMLLILDNCEHLVDACASLSERLQRAAPDLHLLATSREALGVVGEVIYRVPSLGLPDPDLPATPESATQC